LLKIYGGEIRERMAEGKAGVVVWVGSDFIEVAAGEGSYLIKEVQLEGRKKMTLREFLSGHSIPAGTVFQ
jgi:methionyl-tRNA formyltransferase